MIDLPEVENCIEISDCKNKQKKKKTTSFSNHSKPFFFLIFYFFFLNEKTVSQPEIIYLWNHFIEATNGKNEMNFPIFLKVIENQGKLNQGDIFFSKALFTLFDEAGEGTIIFENYVVICNAMAREHLEKKLESKKKKANKKKNYI